MDRRALPDDAHVEKACERVLRVVYLHMFRGLLYGSHKNPREFVWILGMLIYLCLMAEAFFGYLLPWGEV